jgi:Mal s 1 allergenic protein-like
MKRNILPVNVLGTAVLVGILLLSQPGWTQGRSGKSPSVADDRSNAESAKPAIRQESSEGIRHSFLMTGSTTSVLYDEDSKVVWEVKEFSRDGYVLENGNILISTGKAAREYRKGTTDVIWEYTVAAENDEVGTVQRLSNGRTMLVELGVNPRILEIDKAGKIQAEVPLRPETDNHHMQTRMARKRANGNYLVPHLLAFKIKEYTPSGKVVREIPTDLPELGGRESNSWPFTVIELDNGNILANLTHGNKTVEFDPTGKVVWRCDNSNVDGQFADPCGGQRLPNGNTVIGAYGQKKPGMPKVFEVTRDKKVVWEFFHPTANAHEIHIITTNGKRVDPVMR